MTDPDAAQRAREWLEQRLADLAQLRNASRRDPAFKTWRQQTLTVIQRVWPGDMQRVERFRRIPFSPPTARASDQQVREYYERGWGEAGVLLRQFLAEIDLLGLPQIRAAGTSAGAETEAAMGPIPALDRRAAPKPPAKAASTAGGVSRSPGGPAGACEDDIGRAMDRLLSNSPVFRGSSWGVPAAPAEADPEPDSPAAELIRLAGELEALGLSPSRASQAREAFLALALAARSDAPAWELVSNALGHAGATPALALRVLPLLLEFVAKAA